METLTYSNVTEEQITSMLTALQSNGFEDTPAAVVGPGSAWSISGPYGIKATATYDGSALTVQIHAKDFFVTMAAIDSQIKKALGMNILDYSTPIMRREAEYRRQSLLNPNRRGPKPKARRRAARP